jgi:hypothetical protein
MKKLVDRITLIAVCLLSITLVSALVVKNWHKMRLMTVVHAQGSSAATTKTLVVNKTQRLGAIEVLQVLEGTADIAPGDPSDEDMRWLEPNGVSFDAPQIRSAYSFQDGDSWLKDFTLVLRNRTSKDIVRVELSVTFPETVASGAMAWPRVTFGRWPANVAFYATGEPMPVSADSIVLAPGQSMGFNVANHESGVRAVVERSQAFSTVSICYVHFGVSFDDGMIWTEAGGYANPDPQSPGKYLPPDRSYFPGPLMGSAGE